MKIEVSKIEIAVVFLIALLIGIFARMGATGAQAMSTLVVGMAVAAIAYMQWRTAHQKVMIDLFDKRSQALTDLEAHLKSIPENDDRMNNALKVMSDFHMLFGDDVARMCNALILDAATIDVERYKYRLVREQYLDLKMACEPYMRMQQKATPVSTNWRQTAEKRRKDLTETSK